MVVHSLQGSWECVHPRGDRERHWGRGVTGRESTGIGGGSTSAPSEIASPAGFDRADDFDFKEIKVSRGEYFGQRAGTQSLAGLLTQSLKWGTHEWTADIRVTGPNTDLSWTTDTWKKDLPEAKEITINYGTDVFYLSMPGTYEVTVKLIPVGAYAGDTAGKVMAEGTGTFMIPAA